MLNVCGGPSHHQGGKDGFKVTTFSSSMKLNMCVEKGESFSIEINTEGKYAIEKKNPTTIQSEIAAAPSLGTQKRLLQEAVCF